MLQDLLSYESHACKKIFIILDYIIHAYVHLK